nr:glutaminyl-peptide cyclotransferase-like [Ipomoea batatas]
MKSVKKLVPKPQQLSMTALPASFFRVNCRKISLSVLAMLAICLVALLSISSIEERLLGSSTPPLSDQLYTGEVVNEFPHDPEAFTQGLLYAEKDTLFESTGLNGRSSVRRVVLSTGEVEVSHKMQQSDFGEGLTLLGDRLFQVIWQHNTGYIYDRYNLSKFKGFTHEMKDGWGLATDGKVLYGSDGTSTLYQIDPHTMKAITKHTVKYRGQEVPRLNELEYVEGEVWANVWMTDCIARISPKDGMVLGWILLPSLREGLLASGHDQIDVLNGIAWDKDRSRIFVTGKLWPKLFEIKVHPLKTPFKGDVKKMCIP